MTLCVDWTKRAGAAANFDLLIMHTYISRWEINLAKLQGNSTSVKFLGISAVGHAEISLLGLKISNFLGHSNHWEWRTKLLSCPLWILEIAHSSLVCPVTYQVIWKIEPGIREGSSTVLGRCAGCSITLAYDPADLKVREVSMTASDAVWGHWQTATELHGVGRFFCLRAAFIG